MSIFNSKPEKHIKEYCLIGLNKFNYEIGQILLKEGHKVTVIDSDQKKINTLGSEFHYAIVCDVTNINDLSDIGIQFFDYVILGIADMETSVITAANLKELEVEKVLCKAKDEKHRRILQLLGIKIAFIPEEEIATKIAYRAMYDLNVELFAFDNNSKETLIIRISANNSDIWNKKVMEIDHLKSTGATIISIKKSNGSIKVPVGGEDIIEEGDNICILCRKEKLNLIKQYFNSKEK